jgi:hypothetical protein
MYSASFTDQVGGRFGDFSGGKDNQTATQRQVQTVVRVSKRIKVKNWSLEKSIFSRKGRIG